MKCFYFSFSTYLHKYVVETKDHLVFHIFDLRPLSQPVHDLVQAGPLSYLTILQKLKSRISESGNISLKPKSLSTFFQNEFQNLASISITGFMAQYFSINFSITSQVPSLLFMGITIIM